MRKLFCAVLSLFILVSVSYAERMDKRITVNANTSVVLDGQVFRAPKKCENCSQSSAFLLECGSFSSWTGSAACTANVNCYKRTSRYTTLYVCPECEWSTSSGTHLHKEIHSICSDVLVCPFQ